MRSLNMHRNLILLSAVALAGCASIPPPPPTAAVETEARAFMAAYADDLREHDREAIVARYDPEGAWMIFDGAREFVSAGDLRKSYMEQWRGPESFAWRDLAYEVTGPDSVVVVGGFDWGQGGKVNALSYTGLLRRRDGAWRIRLENEGPVPAR
jgi:hypothetical protein